MLKIFKDRNFFIFWFGEMTSVVGDHISLLAFPWLVLQMTGSALMTGLVFAVQGIPRAALMLAGGALVDRSSPRLVMMLSNAARLVMVLGLAYMITYDLVNLTNVFVIAFLFGIADAFFYPASTSILPSIVPRSMLREGNAVLQVTLHLGMTAGPVLAGLIIAGELNSLSHEPIGSNAESLGTGLSDAYEKDREGLARAFFVDAITFALSLISLFFVKARQLGGDQKSEREESLYREIKVAVQWVVSIPAVRLGFMGMAIIHFLFMPVIYVGLPVLAKSRFADGAYVYGLELAAYGLGALLGATLSGLLRSPSNRNLIPLMFGAFIYSGASLGLVVWYEPYWWAMLLFFFAGIFDSYMYVHFNTWIQRICPEQLLGRVMSILMFMSVGLVPVGNAVIGFALDWNLLATLVGVSATIVEICGAIALNPRARQVQADKVASPEAG